MRRVSLAVLLCAPAVAAQAQSPEIEAFVHCEVEQASALDLARACTGLDEPVVCLMPDALMVAPESVIVQTRELVLARRQVVTEALGVASTAEIAELPQDQACALARAQISGGGALGQLLDGLGLE